MDRVFEPGLIERADAARQEIDLLAIHVRPDDVVPDAGEGHACDQPHVPGSDHGDLQDGSSLRHQTRWTEKRGRPARAVRCLRPSTYPGRRVTQCRGSAADGCPSVLGKPVEGRAILPERVPAKEASPALVGAVAVRAPGARHAVEDPTQDASSDLMDLASRLGDARLDARLRVRHEEDTSPPDRPACANAEARLAAVLVFPSPWRALVTRIVFAFDSLHTARRLVRRVRYAPAACPCGSSTDARCADPTTSRCVRGMKPRMGASRYLATRGGAWMRSRAWSRSDARTTPRTSPRSSPSARSILCLGLTGDVGRSASSTTCPGSELRVAIVLS